MCLGFGNHNCAFSYLQRCACDSGVLMAFPPPVYTAERCLSFSLGWDLVVVASILDDASFAHPFTCTDTHLLAKHIGGFPENPR